MCRACLVSFLASQKRDLVLSCFSRGFPVLRTQRKAPTAAGGGDGCGCGGELGWGHGWDYPNPVLLWASHLGWLGSAGMREQGSEQGTQLGWHR